MSAGKGLFRLVEYVRVNLLRDVMIVAVEQWVSSEVEKVYQLLKTRNESCDIFQGRYIVW